MEKNYSTADFAHSPLMFYFEVTQACDLVCKHCRAEAQTDARPGELTTDQATALIDQVASFPRPPILVLTGGDPLKRVDLVPLIRHARLRGLQVALTPSATPLATREAFRTVQEAGVLRLGISLDGADAATHDAFRGWEEVMRVPCRCSPTPANWECPYRLTPRSPAATSTSSTHSQHSWRAKESPCGPYSF